MYELWSTVFRTAGERYTRMVGKSFELVCELVRQGEMVNKELAQLQLSSQDTKAARNVVDARATGFNKTLNGIGRRSICSVRITTRTNGRLEPVARRRWRRSSRSWWRPRRRGCI